MKSAAGAASPANRVDAKRPLGLHTVLFSSLVTMGQAAHAVTIDLPANAKLTSTVSVDIQYDDNVFLSRENTQDDWVTRTSPSVSLEREGSSTNFSSAFTVTRGHYRQGSRENFNDYFGNMEWRWRAASLLEVHTSASYSDVAQSILGNPDGGLDPVLLEAERTRRPGVEVGLVFGRPDGRFQGILQQGKLRNEFEDSTRDFTTGYTSVNTSYSISNRVTLGVQVRDTELDYSDTGNLLARDSDERILLASVEYRLPKTQVQLRAGQLEKEFALAEREDFSGPRWDLTMTWRPKSYSTLVFTTGKNIQESVGLADFVDVKSHVFSWTHQWTGRLRSSVGYSQTRGEFVGTERSDEVLRSNFTLQYQPMNWLDLSLGVVSVENNTSLSNIGIENNRYIFGVEAPL